MASLVLPDARDPLDRKVLRCQLNLDRNLALIDFPKRKAGGTTLSETVTDRGLDKDACIYLRAWLDEVIPELRAP